MTATMTKWQTLLPHRSFSYPFKHKPSNNQGNSQYPQPAQRMANNPSRISHSPPHPPYPVSTSINTLFTLSITISPSVQQNLSQNRRRLPTPRTPLLSPLPSMCSTKLLYHSLVFQAHKCQWVVLSALTIVCSHCSCFPLLLPFVCLAFISYNIFFFSLSLAVCHVHHVSTSHICMLFMICLDNSFPLCDQLFLVFVS